MKRMYGDFTIYTEYGLPPETAAGGRSKRGAPGVPDPLGEPGDGDGRKRRARQSSTFNGRNSGQSRPSSTPPFLNHNQGNSTGRWIWSVVVSQDAFCGIWGLGFCMKMCVFKNKQETKQFFLFGLLWEFRAFTKARDYFSFDNRIIFTK